jgi:D-alanyl-D-alanine carboxypeptidase
MKRHMLAMALVLGIAPFAVGLASEKATDAPPTQSEIARYATDLLHRNYRADAPGAAVLVARGDTVLFRAARGEADVEKDVPLRPDSVFRIGSVSKQFAAAGVLKLVEAGKVKLDDPLSKYVPGYPGADRITVLQLLNHTSGVKSYTGLPGYMEGPIRRDLTTAQMIDVFKDEKPDFAPGEKWSYSNSGYVLVGAVIEAASGKPWHVYLDDVLFKPLGMRHTGYGHDPAFASQQVRGYSYDGDKLVPMRPISMTQPHAAGALVSNVDDLLKWNRALHEGRVLKDATYARMITPVGKAADEGIGYGFGLFNDTVRRHKALYHGGGIFGFISSMRYVPGPDITVVVLENDDASNGEERADALARKLAAMAMGEPYPAMQAVKVDAPALQAAEGVYRFDGETRRILRVVDDTLTAQRDRGPRVPLTPIAADDFLYEDGFNRLVLERDARGSIRGLRFFPNGDGEGIVGARTNDPLPSAPVGMQLPRAALERLSGAYANGGMTMKVFLEGEVLKAQLPEQPPVGLRATSPTMFDVEETGATVEFSAGDAPATQVTMRQGGREMTLERTP